MTESPRVICISRALGAGGEIVGRLVSAELGFRYVDEEIVERAAEKADVPADLVADVEARKSLLRRVLPNVARDVASVSMIAGVVPPRGVDASDDYRRLIQQVIKEVAEEGDAVIVAHAASHALAGRPGIFRLLVTAPPDVRARRLTEDPGVTLEAARKIVEQSDRDRADYFKRFYETEELPTDYDLVVNTGTLTPEGTARLVIGVCSTPASKSS